MTTNIPGRGWEWSDEHTQYGVHTHEGKLVWWEQPKGPMGHQGGGASSQAYDDFFASGPDHNCPAEVLADLLRLFGYGDPPWEREK